MRTKKLKILGTVFILMAFMSFSFVSCDTEERSDAEQIYSSGLSIVKTLMGMNEQAKRSPAPGDSPIASIAINGGFTQLVSALVYVDNELDAGLVNLFLNGKDQYTVFAPTDEAFQLLYTSLSNPNAEPPVIIDEISDLPASLVLDVLKYHVVEGRRGSNSVVPKKNPKEIKTILGSKFYVDSNGSITAKGSNANITEADISASNGIIHVIDAVLLPIE